jgi:hypothetical protein
VGSFPSVSTITTFGNMTWIAKGERKVIELYGLVDGVEQVYPYLNPRILPPSPPSQGMLTRLASTPDGAPCTPEGGMEIAFSRTARKYALSPPRGGTTAQPCSTTRLC